MTPVEEDDELKVLEAKLREAQAEIRQSAKEKPAKDSRGVVRLNVDVTPQPRTSTRNIWILTAIFYTLAFLILQVFKLDWFSSLVGAAVVAVLILAKLK